MRKLIVVLIVVVVLAKLLSSGDPSEGPPRREIARRHLAFQTTDHNREYDPKLGQWYSGRITWTQGMYVYSGTFLVRATKFEIKRLPKIKDRSGTAGSDLYPVVVTRVIEREYNPGDIPLDILEARLPRREESELRLVYYKDRETKHWMFRTD